MSGCQVYADGAAAIVEAAKSCPQLRRLNIGCVTALLRAVTCSVACVEQLLVFIIFHFFCQVQVGGATVSAEQAGCQECSCTMLAAAASNVACLCC